jgi:hypothetical protein
MPRAETIGELKLLIKDIADETKITNICDHAGISTMYVGITVGANVRGIKKSRFGGVVPVPLNDPEKEFNAISIE